MEYMVKVQTSQPNPTDLSNKHSYDFLECMVYDAYGNRHDLDLIYQSCGWQKRVIDLSPYRGQTVNLVFNVWQCSSAYPTTATLDSISLWPYQTYLPIVSRNASP